MIDWRIRLAIASVLVLLIAAPHEVEGAQRRKRAAPAPGVQASGATFAERLASLVNNPIAASSIASIDVVDIATGQVVASRNPEQLVAPASNMKLFTTAAALDLLGSKFEYTTTLNMRGTVDAQGDLQGELKIVGRGDPTIGGRFHDGHSTAVFDEWASELKKAGVRTVYGDIIFEYGYFDTNYIHPTWPIDQLNNWYEAPVSALSLQEGCIMVRVLPSRPGGRAIVQLEPQTNYVTVENSCITGRGRGVFITRRPGTNEIVVSGSVPARSGPTEVFVTITNPLQYFATVARETFLRDGIRITGNTRLVEHDTTPDWKVVTSYRTPLPIVTYVINKKSQNYYAEQLLKTIGAEVKKSGSWESGAAAVKEWLGTKVGGRADEIEQVDGSGMSRFNRVCSAAFISLLRYMWHSPNQREFLSSMPYTGEPESRLRHRLSTPPYARQVYAKTGYIVGVIGLSGYIHAQSGKIYAFSFLFNKYRVGVWAVYNLHDQMLKEIVHDG